LDAVTLTCVVGVVLGAHCVRQQCILMGHVLREDASGIGLHSNVFPLRIDCSGESSLAGIVEGARNCLER
jgi:hypothetical protein